jgi:hypothetical protein
MKYCCNYRWLVACGWTSAAIPSGRQPSTWPPAEWQHAEPAAVTPTYCTRILCIAASPRQKGGGRLISSCTWEKSAAQLGWQSKDTAGRPIGEKKNEVSKVCAEQMFRAVAPGGPRGGGCWLFACSLSSAAQQSSQAGWRTRPPAPSSSAGYHPKRRLRRWGRARAWQVLPLTSQLFTSRQEGCIKHSSKAKQTSKARRGR